MTQRRNRKLWEIRERRPGPSRVLTLEREIAGETRDTIVLTLRCLDEFKSIVCRRSGQLTPQLLTHERLAWWSRRLGGCHTTQSLSFPWVDGRSRRAIVRISGQLSA